MTMFSQNGWGCITKEDSPLLRSWTIGPVVLVGRGGALGFVLAHYAQWFHEEIESLQPRDMPDFDDHWWGQRYIGTTNVPSNHWSATAIDLNAARHPQGLKPEETFTASQCRRIRTRIAKYGVLKWGGDFHTIPDAMHTELLGTREATRDEVRAAALELVSTPVGKRLIHAQETPVSWHKW